MGSSVIPALVAMGFFNERDRRGNLDPFGFRRSQHFDQDRCMKCEGTGRIYADMCVDCQPTKCSRCNGTGWV